MPNLDIYQQGVERLAIPRHTSHVLGNCVTLAPRLCFSSLTKLYL
jgi:hypothetical protein